MKHLKLIIALSLISLASFAQVKNLVGKEAPAVVFQGTLGKKVKPDFYKKKILVLDFWATWCAPCIANFPHFNELSEKFASKDVVFALISDEPEGIVNTFFERTKKEVKGLNLTDSTKATKKNFGIQFIPSCVVIDENNIVRWAGAGQELTAEILEAIIKNQPYSGVSGADDKQVASSANTEPYVDLIALKSKISNPPIYKFSVTDGTNSRFGGSMRTLKDGDFSGFEWTKISLGKGLELLSGYSSKIQFITNKPEKLEKVIDIDFSSNSDSTLFQKYTSRIIPGIPRRNMMMELLGDAFKFDLNLEIKQQDYYEIVVEDAELFKKFYSLQPDRASISSEKNELVITGHSIKVIADEVKKRAGLFIQTQILDTGNYDLILDITNEVTLQKSLNFHGLKLVKGSGDMEFLKIDFY